MNTVTSFTTGSTFEWLHDKNVECSDNIRGKVNHQYNRFLAERGIFSHFIPGGTDLEQLGMDKSTLIARPDLYLDACDKEVKIEGCWFHKQSHLDGLNISTLTFFYHLGALHTKHGKDVRGLVNERYNHLLAEEKSKVAASDWVRGEAIPGNALEQLGLNTSTCLNPVVYAKAYGQVIAELETPEKYVQCGPFQIEEIALNVAQWCELKDMGIWAQVCKTWKTFSECNAIWSRFFQERKIPLVEEEKGASFKKEFEILLPRTVSKISEALFGEMIGEIPRISRKCFNFCSQPDPYDTNKKMGETFCFFVIPAGFKRKSSDSFRYTLKDGLLEEAAPSDEILEIPNGLCNLKRLIRCPLHKGTEGFYLTASDEKIFEQYNICSDKTRVVFMRKRAVGMGEPYLGLEKEANRQGFRGVSIGERTFANTISMLTLGTCPDKQLNAYPMTSDTVIEGQRATLFSTWTSLFIELKGINATHPQMGIVPCISAEVASKDPS